MKTSQRRAVLGLCLAGAFALIGYAYYLSLTPATHPDHDHGILNLDAGGRLHVETRDGKGRNLVGAPGKVLIVHFFSTKTPDAASELRGLFEMQKSLAADRGVEFVLIAKDPDFATVDAWLSQNQLVSPDPGSITVDPTGDTTTKMNAKRPLETMFFNAEGKLASQARGRLDWDAGAFGHIKTAKAGSTIE
ncbi:MAG: hypothetical protein DIJKHBIC_03786 [Thermoanaerobaculia bacterium]|nr:hypothetical protein [Thermoanaerobaculia bacterium]